MDDNVIRPTREGVGDERMIATPDLWPLGPVLPLERRSDLGVIVATPGFTRLRVWKINMYDMRLAMALRNSDESRLTGVAFEDFSAPAEVVSAGWTVS